MHLASTKDNSPTLKSTQYNECYHSQNDGALTETLHKHVFPALKTVQKEELRILDICFGLGYNTFATLLHTDKNVTVYSPELDRNLLENLKTFEYPNLFDPISSVIKDLLETHTYKDDKREIHLVVGDAREFIRTTKERFDIIYQDAFSPKVNQELWTLEYFTDLTKLLAPKGVITTYSVATPVRYALYQLGYTLYTHTDPLIRAGTIASFNENLGFEKVNFEEKLRRVENPFVYRD